MKVILFQTGWNYSQDGPGNRLLLHFQGCNFDCPWCSNPEGRSLKGELFVRPDLLDPDVCPHGAVMESGLNRSLCRNCRDRECLGIYRNQGVYASAREYEVEELVEMAVQSRSLFFDGGGVTISGGEATLQFDALNRLLQRLKEEGIHTALETNGSHPELSALFPYIDLLIFDLKHYDFPAVHKVLKNRGAHVRKNLENICQSDQPVLVRVTVIPGFNSSFEDMEKFADLFSSQRWKDNFRLELLYYHDFGKVKWDAIGQEYKGPDESVSEEDKAVYRRIFKERNLDLIET